MAIRRSVSGISLCVTEGPSSSSRSLVSCLRNLPSQPSRTENTKRVSTRKLEGELILLPCVATPRSTHTHKHIGRSVRTQTEDKLKSTKPIKLTSSKSSSSVLFVLRVWSTTQFLAPKTEHHMDPKPFFLKKEKETKRTINM